MQLDLKPLHLPTGPERCGVVLVTGEVVELENTHPEPETSFAMPYERVAAPEVIATWHTHPRTGPNLSMEDYKAFMQFPDLRHYVVAAQGVWCFYTQDDILLCEDNPAEILP